MKRDSAAMKYAPKICSSNSEALSLPPSNRGSANIRYSASSLRHLNRRKLSISMPGRSRAEFVAKLGIVLEEADETVFWLELLQEKTSSK